jgi:N-acetylglucosaminyl-diphospho-decaprenol L-rhamnosyltransferase
MNEAPRKVLVIIVNYRSAALTLRALASLAEERRDPSLALTVLVVENASGDEANLRRGIETHYGDFAQLVVSPTNGGFGAGNNLGLKVGHDLGLVPDYVHMLNPDTEVKPGALTSLVRFMDAHPKAGLSSGSFEDVDGSPWPVAFRFPSISSELETGFRWRVVSRFLGKRAVARTMGDEPEPIDWCSGASMMVRREVLESVGGFDERFFLYFEEVDLCLRIKEAGWEIWYVPESRVMHVRGQSTGVTALDRGPKRLPAYWYESRRRYFVKHHGAVYAGLADAAALVSNSFGVLKDKIKRVSPTPHLLRDITAQSVVWPKNRELPRAEYYVLPKSEPPPPPSRSEASEQASSRN